MVEPIIPKNNRALPHVALYTRVSTREQVEEGYSLEDQQHQLTRWCDDQFGPGGYTASLYCDDGYSGAWGLGKPYGNAPRFRPRLTEMVADIEAGHVDAVVFVRVDRLTRSPALWAVLLDQYFMGMDIRAVSIKEGFDLGTPHGRLAAGMMVQIASYFREWTADNLRDALLRRKELGYPHGKPPFGWRWQTDSEVIPDERRGFMPVPEEGHWVAKAARWYLSGWSPSRIADEFNRSQLPRSGGTVAWNASDIRRMLRCPIHAGLVMTRNGPVAARHWEDRLYDETTYQQLIDLAGQRGQTASSTLSATHYLLGGLLECGHCGRKLFGFRNRTDNQLYYRCERRETPDGPNCPGITKLAALLHSAVVDSIRDLATSEHIQAMTDEQIEKLVSAQDADLDGDLRRLHQQYRRLDEQFAGLTRLRMQDELTPEEFRAQAEPIRAQRDEVMSQIEKLQERREARELRKRNAGEVRDAVVAFPELWDNLDDDEKRRLLQLTVEKLVLYGPSDTAVLKLNMWQMPGQEIYLPNVRSVGERLGEGLEALTVRDMEVLDLRHQGLSIADIARRWGLSRSSVQQYQSTALHKLGVRDIMAAWEATRERIEAHRHVLHRKPRLRRKDGRERQWRPTERQLQFVRNRLAGMSAPESAQALGIKTGTVHATIDNLKVRAGVDSFEALVDKLVEWGLIDRPPGDREEESPETSGPPPVTLGPMQFRVWTLHSEGKSRGEIAQALGIEPSAVTQNLYHVRKKLRAWLEAQQAESAEANARGADAAADEQLNAVPVVGPRTPGEPKA